MPHAAVTTVPQQPQWLTIASQLFTDAALVKAVRSLRDDEEPEHGYDEYAIWVCNDDEGTSLYIPSGYGLYKSKAIQRLHTLAELCARYELDFIVGTKNNKLYVMLTTDVELFNIRDEM